jgi:tetratricopeptide (TPR) repeat protein
MPAPAKQIPSAELAALEHAFAADPSSEAYRPLTEAYLGMGRFMEAMVVCKKGVKAFPGDPAPRIQLARIYEAQGKDRKALEELTAVLAAKPEHVAANRMAGLLLLKVGEKEPGIAALRKSWEAGPSDAETLDAMKKWGLSFAPPVPPPPPPEAAPPPTPPSTATSSPTASPTSLTAPGGEPSQPRDLSSTAPAGQPSQSRAPAPDRDETRSGVHRDERGQGSTASATSEAPPAPSRAASGPRNSAYSEELASRYSTQEYTLPHPGPGARAPAKRSRGPLVATLGLGLALALVLATWGIVSSMRKARAFEMDRLLRQTRELLEKDSYSSYKEAAKLCEKVLERDSEALGGHAYLAYIDAVRFGEHGESEGLREEAKKHLEAAAKVGQHSHAFAADAYLRFYAGNARGAIEELKKVMAGPEGASSLLHGVLGVIEMQAGDLDGAREDLTLARQIAPGDVRITQMLAEQWRRRGQGFEIQASALYDTALTRLAPDHVPSLLGKAQLLLDSGRPDEAMKRIAKVLEMGQGASPRQVAVAHALRGSVLHAQGKANDGDAEEQQALALDPSNPDIHDLVGRRKLRGGDVSGAAEAFQKAIQLDPARLGFYVNLASAFLQRPAGAKQAVIALERASERVGNARVTKLLGDAYRADNDLDRARAAYEKAIAMEKRYPEAHLALGRVYRDKRDYGKALEELDRAVKEYGESTTGSAATAWADIAETEELRGSPVETVQRAYATALKADPQNCPALFWLGRSRSDRRSRSYDRPVAFQMLSDYLRVCPRGPRAAEAQRFLAGLR